MSHPGIIIYHFQCRWDFNHALEPCIVVVMIWIYPVYKVYLGFLHAGLHHVWISQVMFKPNGLKSQGGLCSKACWNQRRAALKKLEDKKGYYHKFYRNFSERYNLVIQEPANFYFPLPQLSYWPEHLSLCPSPSYSRFGLNAHKILCSWHKYGKKYLQIINVRLFGLAAGFPILSKQ